MNLLERVAIVSGSVLIMLAASLMAIHLVKQLWSALFS